MGGCCASLKSLGIAIEKNTFSNEFYNCNVYSHQGYHKRQMEDRNIVCLTLPDHPLYALFAVFDGFNGSDASSYLSDNILHIINELDITDLDDDNCIINAVNAMDIKWLQLNEGNNAGSTFVFAITKIIFVKQLQSELTELISPSSIHSTPKSLNSPSLSHRSSKSNLNCPTLSSQQLQISQTSKKIENPFQASLSYQTIPSNTCETDEIHDFEVRVFWAGDSRAIAIGKNKLTAMTTDHQCSKESERKRIESADGEIINNRIDGILEVSRGFGCDAMKNNRNLGADKQKVIVNAECNRIICKQNESLLIFCDGLVAPNWSNEIIGKHYKDIFELHKDEKHSDLKCLIYLTERAMDYGSRDNISSISVQFK